MAGDGIARDEVKLCKGCGAKFSHIENEATGNFLPAQQVRSLYVLEEDPMFGRKLRKVELPRGSYYVSHFETCPQANDFSRGRT
jgi:hypothetical protein